MADGTPKRENFPIPRVLMVRMVRKDTIFDGMSTKKDAVDYFAVNDEDNI